MKSDKDLKRSQFANSIRQEQRQRIKKEIRQRYYVAVVSYDQYQEEEFRQYRQKCRATYFALQDINSALNYLFSKNIVDGVGQEVNMKFLNDVTAKLLETNQPANQAILYKINHKLRQVIQYEISKSPKDEKLNVKPTKQLSELSILKNCFDQFLVLLQKYPCYKELWIPFTVLRNGELKRYGFANFGHFVTENLEVLEQEDITLIAICLQNFLQDCKEEIPRFFWLIDCLYNKYDIGFEDTIKFVDLLGDILLGPHVESKVKLLNQETQIIPIILEYLDKNNTKNGKSFELIGRIATFVARIFSVENDELCARVYEKDVMMIWSLRSWLPVVPNITEHMLSNLGSGNLLHSNFKSTKFIIYAFTNIVATEGFIGTIMKSDLYRALIYMYKMMPTQCRQEISVFMYNMVNKADLGTLRVMLEVKFPEILVEMLKEESSEIVQKALKIISHVWKRLEEGENTNPFGNMGPMAAWLYSRQKFKIELQNLGAIKLIESLIHSPVEEVNAQATLALEMVSQ